MSEQLWSDWIEHKPGDPCPIPWTKAGEFEWACGVARGSNDGDATTYHWGWANTITRYRCLLSAAPKEQPWCPPQQEGFGEWIEFSGTCPPVAADIVCDVLSIGERDRKHWSASPDRAIEWYWSAGDFVAYCIKLEDRPTAAEVEAPALTATEVLANREEWLAAQSQAFQAGYWGQMRRMEELTANDAMKSRDNCPPSERERQYQMRSQTVPGPAPRAEPAGVTVVAPIGQRVGSGWWGASV